MKQKSVQKNIKKNQLKFLCRSCLKKDTEKKDMRAIPPKRKPITKEEKERASKKRKQTLKEKYGKLISLKDLSLELNRDFTWLYFLTKNLNIRINGKHNCYVKKAFRI